VRACRLAVELTCLFARDTELAVGLHDAQRRLREANDRLWSGPDPDGLRAIYGHHPQFEAVQLQAALDSRCEVLDCADPLGALQEAHWQIHRANAEYQQTAEQRRQLAADIGELSARLVDTLVAAGWSEQQARRADLHELAAASPGTKR
jgi:hypothetical protein